MFQDNDWLLPSHTFLITGDNSNIGRGIQRRFCPSMPLVPYVTCSFPFHLALRIKLTPLNELNTPHNFGRPLREMHDVLKKTTPLQLTSRGIFIWCSSSFLHSFMSTGRTTRIREFSVIFAAAEFAQQKENYNLLTFSDKCH